MIQIASTDVSERDPKNGTPLPGISALKSVSGGPFLGLLLICAECGRIRTDGDGHWLLVGQRNGIGASRKNHVVYEDANSLTRKYSTCRDLCVETHLS